MGLGVGSVKATKGVNHVLSLLVRYLALIISYWGPCAIDGEIGAFLDTTHCFF